MNCELKKHTIVVGSGISGLTAALLLAKRGRQVTIIEKLPHIGGFLNRFNRGGLRFDTGFHFTGGFGGILSDFLELLDFQDDVKPAPIPRLSIISVKIGITKPKLITLNNAKIMQYNNPQIWIAKTPKIAAKVLLKRFLESFKI